MPQAHENSVQTPSLPGGRRGGLFRRAAESPEGVTYRLDPGKQGSLRPQSELDYGTEAFRNAALLLDEAQLLENIQKVQRRRNLPQSKALVATKSAAVNLDVEMETGTGTGTGKTYVYIRTMFELNRRSGWGKFIVVVPSIAIREGIQKSLEITSEHRSVRHPHCWMKSILGNRHLMAESPEGVVIQTYSALIAALMLQLPPANAPPSAPWS